MPQIIKTALIVGASRGLGLGLVEAYLAEGWRVIATRRGGAEALEALAPSAGNRLVIETLEVTDPSAIAGLRQRLADETLDLLFVSAGVSNSATQKIDEVSAPDFATVMLTNAWAPLQIIEALADRVAAEGTIVAMSSILGSVSANTGGGYDTYRASKAALNTLLRGYAARARARAVIAIHPGWVRTDMGGSNADLSVEESVAGMLKVIASRAGMAGCTYLDYSGKTIPW